MNRAISAEIVKVEPSAMEDNWYVVDAFILFRYEGKEFWSFIPDWRATFAPGNALGSGKQLLEALPGKKATIELHFLALQAEAIDQLVQSISRKLPTVSFDVSGKVTEVISERPGSAVVGFDCGIPINVNLTPTSIIRPEDIAKLARKGNLLHISGRLDAKILEVI